MVLMRNRTRKAKQHARSGRLGFDPAFRNLVQRQDGFTIAKETGRNLAASHNGLTVLDVDDERWPRSHQEGHDPDDQQRYENCRVHNSKWAMFRRRRRMGQQGSTQSRYDIKNRLSHANCREATIRQGDATKKLALRISSMRVTNYASLGR